MATIEEKAKAYAKNDVKRYEPFYPSVTIPVLEKGIVDAYQQGAKDFLSLPLVEKLTDYEKERIKSYYSISKLGAESKTIKRTDVSVGICSALIEIFGSDFFKNETTNDN